MTNPETMLTVSALSRLAQTTEGITAASRATASRLMDSVLSELMPGFQGDAAVASLGCSNAVNDKLRLIHADMDAMHAQVLTTGQQHGAHDTAVSANFSRLTSLLNQA